MFSAKNLQFYREEKNDLRETLYMKGRKGTDAFLQVCLRAYLRTYVNALFRVLDLAPSLRSHSRFTCHCIDACITSIVNAIQSFSRRRLKAN